jgi:hypothetical protein
MIWSALADFISSKTIRDMFELIKPVKGGGHHVATEVSNSKYVSEKLDDSHEDAAEE